MASLNTQGNGNLENVILDKKINPQEDVGPSLFREKTDAFKNNQYSSK
jgi:hypothetical protein